MNFLKAFKNYLHQQEQVKSKEERTSGNYANVLNRISKSTESFELIMLDILQDEPLEAAGDPHKKSEQFYEDLIFEEIKEDEHEEIENIYMKDFIFVNKLSEARELSVDQWNQMVKESNISIFPKKNIYFSIFKGIKFVSRKNIWQLFANTPEMKKLTNLSYKQIINEESLRPDILIQIDKDVPRSKSITKFLPELRNILIGYCVLTKKQYTQGMNLIAGSLLSLLALENDQQLQSFEIFEKQFQERTFWIFIGVMVWKNWQDLFDKDLVGLTKRLQVLQGLMVIHVPAVYQKLIDFEWDLTILSQYYLTIMLYNTPREFSKIILDLFFLDGQNALHSLIIRMMKMQQDKILGFSDECELMNYFKKEMIMDCYLSVKKNQPNAQKLQDFELNFMKNSKN